MMVNNEVRFWMSYHLPRKLRPFRTRRLDREYQARQVILDTLFAWRRDDEAVLDDTQFAQMAELAKGLTTGDSIVTEARADALERVKLKALYGEPIDDGNVASVTHLLVMQKFHRSRLQKEYDAIRQAVADFAPQWLINQIAAAREDDAAYRLVVELMTKPTGAIGCESRYVQGRAFPRITTVSLAFVDELSELGIDVSGILRAYAVLEAIRTHSFSVSMLSLHCAVSLVSNPAWLAWQLQLLLELMRHDGERETRERSAIMRKAHELLEALPVQPSATDMAAAS